MASEEDNRVIIMRVETKLDILKEVVDRIEDTMKCEYVRKDTLLPFQWAIGIIGAVMITAITKDVISIYLGRGL